MIWCMADLEAARHLRDRITSPFASSTRMGNGMDQIMKERLIQMARNAELIIHPHDIVVEMEDPILATDMVVSGDWYGTVVARWEPGHGRPISFKGLGEPADSLFGGISIDDFYPFPEDTITLELDSRAYGGETQKIPTALVGWSEEERAWVYGPKPGISEESGDVAGNGRVTVSFSLGR